MPSRVIRDSLIESDRWLSLAHPTERLAYIVLLLKADDLATADATDGQLVRLWRETCNLKGPEDALRILSALVDADLVRPYEAGGKRLVFIPRFRQRFRASTFRRPPPPDSLLNDEPDVLENIRQIKTRIGKMSDKGPTEDRRLSDDCQTSAPVGVVVVEDEGVDEVAKPARKRATPAPKEFAINEGMHRWASAKGLDTAFLQAETEKFLDHHRSKGNSFKDWEAAWRKWMSNAIAWAKPAPATAPKDRYVRS